MAADGNFEFVGLAPCQPIIVISLQRQCKPFVSQPCEEEDILIDCNFSLDDDDDDVAMMQACLQAEENQNLNQVSKNLFWELYLSLAMELEV